MLSISQSGSATSQCDSSAIAYTKVVQHSTAKGLSAQLCLADHAGDTRLHDYM